MSLPVPLVETAKAVMWTASTPKTEPGTNLDTGLGHGVANNLCCVAEDRVQEVFLRNSPTPRSVARLEEEVNLEGRERVKAEQVPKVRVRDKGREIDGGLKEALVAQNLEHFVAIVA